MGLCFVNICIFVMTSSRDNCFRFPGLYPWRCCLPETGPVDRQGVWVPRLGGLSPGSRSGASKSDEQQQLCAHIRLRTANWCQCKCQVCCAARAVARQKCLIFMMTSSNGNSFRATGHLCGEFPVTSEFPSPKTSDDDFLYFLWSAPE